MPYVLLLMLGVVCFLPLVVSLDSLVVVYYLGRRDLPAPLLTLVSHLRFPDDDAAAHPVVVLSLLPGAPPAPRDRSLPELEGSNIHVQPQAASRLSFWAVGDHRKSSGVANLFSGYLRVSDGMNLPSLTSEAVISLGSSLSYCGIVFPAGSRGAWQRFHKS